MNCYQTNINSLPPFLKWAGGKRWLVSELDQLVPKSFNRYYEPFVGSGAVFFSIRPADAVLSDSNRALIETYQAIKDDWRTIARLLGKHQKKHSKEYYYKIRSKKYNSSSSRAAQLIYLNRTCWNGLYRVNLNGDFNVPIGSKNKVILDSDNFKLLSANLQKATLITSDFEKIIDASEEDDFVFVDPPYTVKHNKNGFLKYNESIFSWDDQVRLCECVKRAAQRGTKIVLTNADHASVRSLYENDFEISSMYRTSVLSGSSKYRGKVTELLALGNL